MTDFQKAVTIHDEIILSSKYDLDTSDHNSAYDVLVGKNGNCQGFTSAYAYLLALAGIKNEIVDSATRTHVWNKVCIDGIYYNVDVTWDDPNQDRKGHVSHKYFLLSDSEMNRLDDHDKSGFSYFASPDTRYDNKLYHEFDTKLCFINNQCYAIDNTGNSQYEETLLNYNVEKNTATVLQKFDYRWESKKDSFWVDSFMGLAEFNGILYYNTPHSVNTYDIKENKEGVFSAVSTDTYYGIIVEDGNVYVNVSSSPNVEGTFKQVCKSLSFGEVSSVEEDVLRGDCNLDGDITISDVSALQKYLAGTMQFDAKQKKAADFNRNGDIDISDVTAIQKYLAGID